MSELAPSVLARLPQRQAAWTGAQALTASALAAAGTWASEPSLALSLSLGAGVAVVSPKRLWSVPLVVGGVTLAGLLSERAGVPAVLGAAAVAGLAMTWMLVQQPDRWDLLHGLLGTVAAAGLGLWAAARLIPAGFDGSGGPLEAGLAGGLLGLVAAQGMLPLALRLDADPLPTEREIRQQLAEPYRPPALRAVRAVVALNPAQCDAETRRGLGEVARWVLKLQGSLVSLDAALAQIDVGATERRVAELESGKEDDTFTRERRLATAAHLRRMMQHGEALRMERQRTEALVDYALAYIDEARVGLVIASELPGEAGPHRLNEVLGRLRAQAAGGEARRQTRRELSSL